MTIDRDVIINLLYNLGSRREVSKYLDALTSDQCVPPIVIKAGGAIIADSLDELATAIACLAYLGVCPVVVHGAGPQITAALAQAGIRSEFLDGHRVTTPETLDIVQHVFTTVNAQLAAKIESYGVPATCFCDGVLTAAPLEPRTLGCVGTITNACTCLINAARTDGAVPVVSPLAVDVNGNALNVNSDVAARALAATLGANKAVFLTELGGLLDMDQRLIPALNIADDYER